MSYTLRCVGMLDRRIVVWQAERVLDRETAAALVREAAPELGAEAILSEVQLGWRLVPSNDPDPVVRIGGSAPLLEGEAWPANARGVQMTFLASIDTARLPADRGPWPSPSWGHRGGVVRIFADLVDEPYDCGPVWLSEAPAGAPLRLVEAPPLPDPFPEGGPQESLEDEERERELPFVGCGLEPLLTIPDRWDVSSDSAEQRAADQRSAASEVLRRGRASGPGQPEEDDWDESDPDEPLAGAEEAVDEVIIFGTIADTSPEFQEEVRQQVADIHEARHSVDTFTDDGEKPTWEYSHLLGFPVAIQDDPRWIGEHEFPEVPGLEPWQALLTIHSGLGDEIGIADGGHYVVIIPTDDLAAGRYDRTFLVLESS